MANYVDVMARTLHFYKFTISRRGRQVNVTHMALMPAHKPQSVSDWSNLHSLGTISAFGSIANLA